MSGPVSVAVVATLLTLCGAGFLGAVGHAQAWPELARAVPIAPLAGMALAGVAGATLGVGGSRLGMVDLILLTLLWCIAGAVRVVRGAPGAAVRICHPRTRVDLGLIVGSVTAIVIVLVEALSVFLLKPLAEYDGWAMWGMKARAIATLGGADPDLFASRAYERLHLEYPLLLPSLHALPLQAEAEFSSNTVVLNCLVIGLAGLLAVWGTLRDRVRPALLLPFLAAIATTPAFFGQLATGYADVPVAMFVAAGAVAGARWLLDKETSWLALATLFFSGSVLSKNEGLLFAVAAYAALAAVAVGRRKAVAVSATIVALIYAPWRTYVVVHDLGAPDYDLSSSFNFPWVVGRLDRAPIAAEGLLKQATDLDQFGILLLLGIACIVVTLAIGPRSLGLLAAGFTALSFAGLVWIYVLTPNEVSSYLATNGNRVIVSLVMGLAALSPLLIEESVRGLQGAPSRQGIVGTSS